MAYQHDPRNDASRAQATFTRREAIAAMAAAGVAPMFVPARVLGAEAPSEQLRIGCIGTGRKGRGDMGNVISAGSSRNARIVAVCDVDKHRAEAAKKRVEQRYRKQKDMAAPEAIKIYHDFRELLARDDIDGVTISTPDHWHAAVAVRAAEAGKDIYGQKPLTSTIREGRALVNAVHENDVIFQTGSQHRSSVYIRRTCELVRGGAIGEIQRVEVTLATNEGRGDPTPMDVPAGLDYDFWLGPTPQVPYTLDRVHPESGFTTPGWMQTEPYCRGMLTNWGAHYYDVVQWALGVDQSSGPVKITCSAKYPDRGLWDVHTTVDGEAYYENGVKMTSGSTTRADSDIKFIGEGDKWISVRPGEFKAHDRSIFRTKIGPDRVQLYESGNHTGNWLDCMRSRKPTIAPAEAGHRSNTVPLLHYIAAKTGRTLEWDPRAERFKNSNEANAMLDYWHRRPWTV